MPEIALKRLNLEESKRLEIESYLQERWKSAERTRKQQIEDDYIRWNKIYRAVPKEETRSFPWYNASNFIVQIARMFVDTQVARTLNLIFSTRPLYVIDGFPRKYTDELQMYLNRKALYEWDHYLLAREICDKGRRNGTAVTKSVYHFDRSIYMGDEEKMVTKYDGPRTRVIPFPDFYVYPITAERMEDVDIKFHRRRVSDARARKFVADRKWQLNEEQLESALTPIAAESHVRETTSDAHTMDNEGRELKAIETYFEYELGGKYYQLVGVLEETQVKLIDLYYYTYPENMNIFNIYKPNPREGLFFGDADCEILQQGQEEVSRIHNDRRNNSYLANAPFIKRRQNSLVPDLDAGWYPGKIWDLENMNDFEVVMLGRNYSDTIPEEQFSIQLLERTMGVSAPMQGLSQGSAGKRGIYNTQGTIASMHESNTRQDTNVRDVREVMGSIGRVELAIQATYVDRDATLDALPDEVREKVNAALQMVRQSIPMLMRSRFEVKTSNAAFNTEAYKQSLLQVMGTLSNYGNTVMGMAGQLANPQLNPSIRLLMNDLVSMHKWLATRILHAFGEYDLEGVLPDVKRAIETTVPGGGRGTETEDSQESAVQPNGAAGPQNTLDLGQLQALSQMETLQGGETGG